MQADLVAKRKFGRTLTSKERRLVQTTPIKSLDPAGARIGAVVIGRNEARRLPDALKSVRAADIPLLYVDSASSDESVAIGRVLADHVLELDPKIPLCAARARNEGLAALVHRHPSIEHVLFLDGDCTLLPGFLDDALEIMDARSELAVVVGRLEEKPTQNNIFSRLAALEWSRATGDIKDFGALGGIMVARISDFHNVGGFNPRMIAGEDSEYGVRLELAGRKVTKIDTPMAQHELGITNIRQWWKRSVRAGYALAERYVLHGRSPVQDCRREFFSTLFWGIAVPCVTLVLAWPTVGISLLVLLGYPYLTWRMYRHFRRIGASSQDAWLGARFGFYSKFANALGLMHYFRRRFTGKIKTIEYKQVKA